MKKILSFLLLGLMTATASAFTDTSVSSYETAIDSLYGQDIVQGYSDGTFQPNREINRAEFVKILMEAKYPGKAEGSACFSDVQTDWYAKYVCYAKELNIVDGYTGNTFKPAATINLAEALKIVQETYQTDVCKTCSSVWYEPYYEKAKDLNWLDGLTQSVSHEMTRGEAAQLIFNVTKTSSTTTPTTTVTTTTTPTTTTTTATTNSCQPQPFGFWGLNGSFDGSASQTASNLEVLSAANGMNSFVVATSPSYALNNQLPALQSTGFTAAFRMSGGNAELVDSGGNFILSKWEDLLDVWTGSSAKLQPYLGHELQWHMVLDDIDTFGGKDPTAAELEAMAAYSKKLFPAIKTFIRHNADEMPAGSYPELDAVLNQYTIKKGPLDAYITNNENAAKQLGVDSIWGLNIADGGDGSSGQVGYTTGKYMMSPAEVESYGAKLLAIPGSLGLMLWEYDADAKLLDGTTTVSHFSSSAYQQAFKYLATLANCQ